MATRRQAREWAFQMLFQLDMNPAESEAVRRQFWASRKSDARTRQFAENIVAGVQARGAEIDAMIGQYARNWEIHRMGTVERNVLRMAVYEILFNTEVPAVVAINEAVDIAKYFGTTESGRFVNGILDPIRKDRAGRSRPDPGEHGHGSTPQETR